MGLFVWIYTVRRAVPDICLFSRLLSSGC